MVISNTRARSGRSRSAFQSKANRPRALRMNGDLRFVHLRSSFDRPLAVYPTGRFFPVNAKTSETVKQVKNGFVFKEIFG